MNKAVHIVLFLLLVISLPGQNLSIGSKIHGESRILAEIMAQRIEQNTDLKVERRYGLGGTLICFEALRTGEIDLYPEYTGTLLSAILNEKNGSWSSDSTQLIIEQKLQENYGMRLGAPFGFNNSYALATRPELGLKNISDLIGRNDLRYGFSNEFLKRKDGFPGLNQYYGLQLKSPRGIDHGLAYQALAGDQIDVTDAYTTDGKLETFGFRLLVDDRQYFPPYNAVPVYRKGLLKQHPEVDSLIKSLSGTLDEEIMQSLNYKYEVKGHSLAEIAYDFLNGQDLVKEEPHLVARHPVLRQTIEHIQLTFLATFLGILLAIPLGIFISDKKKLAGISLSFTGILQTIPSLALLGFMIPLFGIGFTPAVIALFLYALLPILRNTYTGINSTDPILIEAARGMGMTQWQILKQVRLPLAMDVIMAGIRTALTINIGTATLAAFIGAGGLGESIITGISLNDHTLILRGAIPAAILALLADQGMALVQKAMQHGPIDKK